MKRFFVVINIFFTVTICYAYEHYDILNIANKNILSLEKFIGEIERADIIVLGEIHDNKIHHNFQLRVIKELHKRGRDIAIALEMFRQENQIELDNFIAGRSSISDFQKAFNENWSKSWHLYSDIFLFAREKRIPLIGVNIPKEITEKVAEKGFFSLSKKDLEKLPPQVLCDVDDDYMTFMRKIFGFHGKSDREFKNFCEAQVLWDKSMAYYVLEYLKKRPGSQIILLTGAVHAWKKAFPNQIKKMNSKIKVITVLPQTRGYIEPSNLTVKDADYLLYEGDD